MKQESVCKSSSLFTQSKPPKSLVMIERHVGDKMNQGKVNQCRSK